MTAEVKVTFAEQLAPMDKLAGQSLVWANSVLFVPVMEMLEMFIGPAPLFFRVTV